MRLLEGGEGVLGAEDTRADRQTRSAYLTSSAVATAPFICGRTLMILTTRRSVLLTQRVVVSPMPSPGVITTFHASNVPAGTVTLSEPSTFKTRGFTCCAMMSTLRTLVVSPSASCSA